MSLFSRVIPLSMLSICTTAFATDATTDGLWATFNVGGERLELRISDSATAQYVRSFAAGREAPRRFCGKSVDAVRTHLDEWIQSAHEHCPYVAQITRVKECLGGECVILKGTYAGRSPSF